MGVYIDGLDMPKKHSLWMVIHPNGQVWMRERHYCQNLEGVEATELDLVRCGECKYYEESEYIEGDMACKYHIRHTYYTEADRFCYYGERELFGISERLKGEANVSKPLQQNRSTAE